MKFIATKTEAAAKALEIVNVLRHLYGVPQDTLADLAMCHEVLEGRKDTRERRGQTFGRRQSNALRGRRHAKGRRDYDKSASSHRRPCLCPVCS